MSRIYFETETHGAEVNGSERAWFGYRIDALLISYLDLDSDWERHPLKKLCPDWVNTSEQAQLHIKTSFGTLGKVDLFELALNTAISFGSDFVALAAYIHGTCEVFGRIEPENFEWFSNTISDGLASGFYRQRQGWDEVLALILKAKEENCPIVMYYSVTDAFPNPYLLCDSEDEEKLDEICDSVDFWQNSLNHLREGNYCNITPERKLFGHELNAIQFLETLKGDMESRG